MNSQLNQFKKIVVKTDIEPILNNFCTTKMITIEQNLLQMQSHTKLFSYDEDESFDREELRRKLLIYFKESRASMINLNDNVKDQQTSNNVFDSGYTTAESSRKSSLDTEETSIENKPQIITIKKHFNTSVTDQKSLSNILKPSEDEIKMKTKNLVNQLLIDIYGRPFSECPGGNYCNLESDCTSTSSVNNVELNGELELQQFDIKELKSLLTELNLQVSYAGEVLVRQLKRRDKLTMRRERQYDVITAYLQDYAVNNGEDFNMRFSMSPSPGDSGYSQWLDAMKMVARLPGGIPPEFRKRLWITLAERHLQNKGVNWAQAERACFNEWSNPDDTELGVQIVKDLHRTGCSLFCGSAGQENQALLKRVLLAYARWNKVVGYCQGFNMLAALILQVMDRSETDSVKVMIYLIEGVLPESYFANNLRGLSVDMAVFRDLLRIHLPHLSRHLELLQNDAQEASSYEPPLTNVFTMQWFLTLFCNCLPQVTVLRVWDLIFLEGNEVLLRTALAIWKRLTDRILAVNSADEFYSIMGVLTQEMLEFDFMDANDLIKIIVSIKVSHELPELRDKYLYNISPWTQTVQSAAKKGFRLFYSDDDGDLESDNDEKMAVTTAYGITLKKRRDSERRQSTSSIQPYAYGHPDREKLALDISALKQQYAKLRERQRQAHIILTAACARQPISSSTSTPIAVNHLLLGKSALLSVHGRRLGPPQGAIPPSRNQKQKQSKALTTDKKLEKAPRENGETIYWKDAVSSQRRRPSNQLSREELQKRLEASNQVPTKTDLDDQSSSSYSDDDSESIKSSDSSTSTELCDEPGARSGSDFDDHSSSPAPSASEKSTNDSKQMNDVIESMSETKVPEVQEIANLIAHSLSESIISDKPPLTVFSPIVEITQISEEPIHKPYLSENLSSLLVMSNTSSISEQAKNKNYCDDVDSTDLLSRSEQNQDETSEYLEKCTSSEYNEITPQFDVAEKCSISPPIEKTSITHVSDDYDSSNIDTMPEYLEKESYKKPDSLNLFNTNVYDLDETFLPESQSLDLLEHNKIISPDCTFALNLKPISPLQTPKNLSPLISNQISDDEIGTAVKPRFETSRSIEVLRENQSILDNYLKQQQILILSRENSEDNVYSNLFYHDNLCSSLTLTESQLPEDSSSITKDSYDNVIVPASVTDSQKTDSNFDSFVLERSALSTTSSEQSQQCSASTFDLTKFLQDHGIELSTNNILQLHHSSSTTEFTDIIEKITTPQNVTPINVDTTPEIGESKKQFDFEKFLDEQIKSMKCIDSNSEPTSSTAAKYFEKQISLDSLTNSSEAAENRLETGRRNSEMALKIIQENSAILHRILQYQSKSIDEEENNSLQLITSETDDAKLRRKQQDLIDEQQKSTDNNHRRISLSPRTQQQRPKSLFTTSSECLNVPIDHTKSTSLTHLQLASLSPSKKKSLSKVSSPSNDQFNPFPVAKPIARQSTINVGVKLGLYKDLSPSKSPTK